MATMFRELAEGRKSEVTLESTTAQRVFGRDDANGTFAQIPTFGTPHPDDDLKQAIVKKIGKEQWGDHPDLDLITVKYESPSLGDEEIAGTGGGGSSSLPIDDLPRSFDTSGEFFSIRDPAEWFWSSNGDSVDQPLFLRIITGELKITKIEDKLDIEKFGKFLGTVNVSDFPLNVGFDKQPRGTFLFIAAPAEEITSNQLGNRKWRITYHFAFRKITHLLASGDQVDDPGGWNHVYRDDSGLWDVPNKSASGTADRLYEELDLNDIFD